MKKKKDSNARVYREVETKSKFCALLFIFFIPNSTLGSMLLPQLFETIRLTNGKDGCHCKVFASIQ